MPIYWKKHLKMEKGKHQTFGAQLAQKYLANHMRSNEDPETIDREVCNLCTKTFANKYILKKNKISEVIKTREVSTCKICL